MQIRGRSNTGTFYPACRAAGRILLIIMFFASLAAVSLVNACARNDADQSTGDAQDKGRSATATAIPKLMDLGAGKCIPCKKMAPILDALREEYRGKFDVVFIDVWKDRSQAAAHRIRLIPTQIYFDASGKELHRHEGFASREDILATWKSLGYTFED